MQKLTHLFEAKLSNLDMLNYFSEMEVSVIFKRVFPDVTKKEMDWLKQFYLIFLMDSRIRLPILVNKFKQYLAEEQVYYFLDSMKIIRLERQEGDPVDFNSFKVREGSKFDYFYNKLKEKIFTFYKIKKLKNNEILDGEK